MISIQNEPLESRKTPSQIGNTIKDTTLEPDILDSTRIRPSRDYFHKQQRKIQLPWNSLLFSPKFLREEKRFIKWLLERSGRWPLYDDGSRIRKLRFGRENKILNLKEGTGKACDWHHSTTSCVALRKILLLLSSIVVGAFEPTGSIRETHRIEIFFYFYSITIPAHAPIIYYNFPEISTPECWKIGTPTRPIDARFQITVKFELRWNRTNKFAFFKQSRYNGRFDTIPRRLISHALRIDFGFFFLLSFWLIKRDNW